MKITRGIDRRVHARIPQQWGAGAFTDWWLSAGEADSTTAAAAGEPGGLDGFGWVITSVLFTNSVTGDFLSTADMTPPNWGSNAQNDVLASPIIFGSGSQAQMVSKLLGYVPTTLVAEFYAAFTVASSGETNTNIGFYNGAANVMTIYSDATNFKLHNGSAASAAGPAVDNAYHTWKISITGGTATWYVDGTLVNTLAIVNDVWPAAFALESLGANNRISVAWAHVWLQ